MRVQEEGGLADEVGVGRQAESDKRRVKMRRVHCERHEPSGVW